MRLSTVSIAFAVALIGCALPPPPPAGDGDGDDEVDAGGGDDEIELTADAGPRPDGRPARTTELTHSSSMTVQLQNSVACENGDGSTAATSYYRVFDLAALGVSGRFRVDQVEFGVDRADGGNDNTQPLAVLLHTLDGTFTLENLTQLAVANLTLADTIGTNETADFNAIEVPAGSTLVVEVRSPDGDNNNEQFYVGSNSAGQTGPSYIRAAACGDSQPRDLADIGFANVHIVLRVTGTTR